jgi:hypothetical protein
MLSRIAPKLTLIATFLFVIAVCAPALGDVIITIAPAAGTDLSNVHAGDTLVFNTFASSTDVGERFIAYPHVHLLGDGDYGEIHGVYAPTVGDFLTNNPIIIVWTVQVSGPGPSFLYNGWPDCTGLPSDNTGCAITDLGSSRPADSNYVRFEVQPVPEPTSMALLGSGLLSLVGAGRKKFKR